MKIYLFYLPCTLYPAPCTLHLVPCTLYLVPCTSHPMIVSIFFSSSPENSGLSNVPRLSFSCSTVLAPTSTEVILASFRSQASAICARLWPRFFANSLSCFAFLTTAAVTCSFLKKPCGFAALESSGIPLIYLSVSNPWASGEKAIQPIPSFSRTLSNPFSLQRSNMEYFG